METKQIKPVSIKDLKPQEASIILHVKGQDKSYKMRGVNLDDWVWMSEHFGQDPSKSLSKAIPLNDMAKICYRLLIDKEDFLSEETEVITDDGDKITRKVTGPEKLKKALIGFEGIDALSTAFTRCLGVGEMSPEEMEILVKNSQKKTKKKATKRAQ